MGKALIPREQIQHTECGMFVVDKKMTMNMPRNAHLAFQTVIKDLISENPEYEFSMKYEIDKGDTIIKWRLAKVKPTVIIHKWNWVAFSYASWYQCDCGYEPRSQEDMDTHIVSPANEGSTL